MFSRTERLNRTFSCSTTPIWRRSQAGSSTARSMPSISTRPLSGTYRRWTSLAIVLLPEPEGPTMPTTCPAGTSKLTSCRIRAVDPIAERDVIELDVAVDRAADAPPAACRLDRGVEDVAQPFHRQARLVKVLPDLDQPQHRRTHPPGQHVKGDQLADRQVAVDDELAPRNSMRAVTILLMSWTVWLAQLPTWDAE